LLLRLSLQLGECDLGLGLHTLQIHFALNLHVAERCGLLCRYGDSSGELLLDQFLCLDQIVSALFLGAKLIVGMGHLLSNMLLHGIHFLHVISHDLCR